MSIFIHLLVFSFGLQCFSMEAKKPPQMLCRLIEKNPAWKKYINNQGFGLSDEKDESLVMNVLNAIDTIALAYCESEGFRDYNEKEIPIIFSIIYGEKQSLPVRARNQLEFYNRGRENKISLDKAILILAITENMEPKENSFYWVVNKHRRETEERSEHCVKYFDLLGAALRWLPESKSKLLYRIIIDPVFKKEPAEGDIWEESYQSYSSHILVDFVPEKPCLSVLIKIENADSAYFRKIKKLSKFVAESERMILGPTIKFKITLVNKTYNESSCKWLIVLDGKVNFSELSY